MRGAQEAIDFAPPTGSGTTDQNAPQTLAVPSGSSTAQPTGVTASSGQRFVTFVMRKATANVDDLVTIRFGDSTVAAATSNDIDLIGNQYISFRCSFPYSSHFRITGAAANGTLKWWLSDR